MKRFVSACLGFLCAAGLAQEPAQPLPVALSPEARLVQERVHFLRCLAALYDPAMWLSYQGALYFAPRTEAQWETLQTMRDEREAYQALTNRLTRYAIAAAAIARAGLGDAWQKKLLLPYSETNANLTPTRDLKLRFVPRYEVLTNFSGGDALIATEEEVFFIMDLGRAADDAFRTNAILVREGTKSFKTPAGDYLTAEAFTNAGLNAEEMATLRKAAKGFLTEAVFPSVSNTAPAVVSVSRPTEARPTRTASARAAPKPAAQTAPPSPEEEFLAHRMMAKDSSPYMQFLLARDYLEGRGTPPDEQLGLEWMERAAKNGSGDARTFLENRKKGP